MDKLAPSITDWDPTDEVVLQAENWFETEWATVTLDVDEKGMLGWFMAQGWNVTSSSENRVVGDDATVVKSVTYQLKRRKLQSERVLQAMIGSFTDAYNEGRELNDSRYDEIVTIYTTMLDKTEDELIALESDDDTYDAVIVALIEALDANYETFATAAEIIIDAMETSHTAYEAVIAAMETEVETDQTEYEATIAALLSAVTDAHTTHDTDITTITDAMDTENESYDSLMTALAGIVQADYTTFSGLVESVISSMASDYSTFASSMNGVLNDYGSSIRSQINTRFDNELAKASNDLINRGLYNSTLWSNVSTGIERERSLALSDVADKITQQEIGLTQAVYREQAAMRDRIVNARDRLFERLQGVRRQKGATYDSINSAYMSAKGQIINVLDGLQGQLQQQYSAEMAAESNLHAAKVDMRARVQAAKDQLQSHLDQVQDRRLTAKDRLYVLKTDMKGKVISSRDRLRVTLQSSTDRRLTLRNEVATALLSFMERRTDDYPGIGQLADIASGLGYADGGTVAPSVGS